MQLNFRYLYIFFLSFVLKVVSVFIDLPSQDIDTFIRLYALFHVHQIGYSRSFQLIVNPISIIRYFEFDFVRKNIKVFKGSTILDISSPRWFGFYLSKKNPEISYHMINPDITDVTETSFYLDSLRIPNFKITKENALKLPFKSNSFDTVVSISVIEHIDGTGDSIALKEMWRVLKKGGRLIFTTHVANKHNDEYRNIDQYSQNSQKKEGKYFFQRMYDNLTIKKRVLNILKIKPESMEIIGEKEKGWFDSYIARWIRNGISETVYDPYYLINHFKKFQKIKDLVGVGVIGLVFKK